MANFYSRYGRRTMSPQGIGALAFGCGPFQPQPRMDITSILELSQNSAARVQEVPLGSWRMNGGLGGFGTTSLGAGGLKFNNDHAGANFSNGLGQDGGCDGRPGVFSPLSQTSLTTIDERIAALQDAGSTEVDGFLATAQRLIKRVDNLQTFDLGGFGQCGRSDGREAQYHSALNALKTHLLGVMKLKMPVMTPDVSLNEDVPLTSGGQKKRAISKTGASTAADSGSPKWLLPVGIGIAALVLLGAGTVLLKKKK